MDKKQEIEEIIKQLSKLQVQQTGILNRLDELTESTDAPDAKRAASPTGRQDPKRPFAIGDRVRIRNPGRFQKDVGNIILIGSARTTVLTTKGKVQRAQTNLAHINDE